MRKMIRTAALFAVYGSIGYGGDQAMSLWAQEGWDADESHVAEQADLERHHDVRVHVDPEIRVRVRIGGSEACRYERRHEQTLAGQGVERLIIDAGAGELRVEGRADLEDIQVVGIACAPTEEWLAELALAIDASGSDVALAAQFPDRDWTYREGNARIDLTVLVPLGLAVTIDDSSGEIEVSGTGDLDVEDSSGSISVRQVLGNVRIDDSSGSVRVQDVTGDVELDDGSASVEIHGVVGSVTVRDGSGSLEISQVGSDVIVEADGSGSIQVTDVAGDLVVADDANGSVTWSGVAGTVDVPQDKRRRRRARR